MYLKILWDNKNGDIMLEFMNLNDKNMIAVQGAGGKTSSVFLLANEFKSMNEASLVSTTTKMGIVSEDKFDYLYTFNEKTKIVDGKIYFTSKSRTDTKEIGFEPEFFDKIFLDGLFSNIILETDGAKTRPIKAPREDEPVNPKNITHCVGVMGLDSVNKPFDEKFCHRKEYMKKIIGNPKILTTKSYAEIINSNCGLFKNSYDAKKFLILNKADTKQDIENAMDIIERIDVDVKIFVMSFGKIIKIY